MTADIIRDIGNISSRLFDDRPFLCGEIRFCLKEFEKRGDQEIENLFTTIQTTTELNSGTIVRCKVAAESNLPDLKLELFKTLAACEGVLTLQKDKFLIATLEKNRQIRKEAWQIFVDDMTHKCSRIDFTFEEKEEELCEFYSDLEQKLHNHK